MKITLICSDASHPVNEYLMRWKQQNCDAHQIELVRTAKEFSGGDALFIVSCTEIIGPLDRALYRASLVLHASDLPRGRGWSPHIWNIIKGDEAITVSLIEAENIVDSGRIWYQITSPIAKHELWNEINNKLFSAEIALIDLALKNFEVVAPLEQKKSVEPTYFPKRQSGDSKINPELDIKSQFDLLRVCDPIRFPAYFQLYGHKYKIVLEKIND